jgi:hypothetical protein
MRILRATGPIRTAALLAAGAFVAGCSGSAMQPPSAAAPQWASPTGPGTDGMMPFHRVRGPREKAPGGAL